MTRTGSIGTVLATEWSLTGDLSKSKVKFPLKEWFDSDYPSSPQVTVTPLADTLRFYSHNGTLKPQDYQRYVLNVWLPVPTGANPIAYEEMIESMRNEAYQVILANGTAIGSFKSIVPLDTGVPRHEVAGASAGGVPLTGQPRCLRYEITLLAVEQL